MLISKLKVLAVPLIVGVALLGAGAAGQGNAEDERSSPDRISRLAKPVRDDGPRLEFLKGRDGYIGRVVPADKDRPPFEFSFGDGGVMIRTPDAKENGDVAIDVHGKGRLELTKGDKEGRSFDDWLSRLERVHQQGDRNTGSWKHEDCRACHTTPERTSLAPVDIDARARNRVVRDLLVRQAVRDIEATLKRLEQDMPDRQTELDALDEIEGAVRKLKEKIKAHAQ